MLKELDELVSELSPIHGVSSREEDVIDYLRDQLASLGIKPIVDLLGNMICHFGCGQPNPKKLMVFAHTDELGFIVRKVENNGFVRISRVGGVSVNVLPGTKVDILCDSQVITGVIGLKSHHVTKPEEKGHLPDIDNLYLDCGFKSKQEAEDAGIFVGNFATFASQPVLRLREKLLCGKAMDNRACCAVLLHYVAAVKTLSEAGNLAWDVYVVFCVQEEFNVRGIMPAVNKIRPDASIGLDVAIAADTPDLLGFSEIALGGGVAISYLNFHGRGTLAGVLPDKKLLKRIESVCKDHGIEYQRDVIIGLITENAFIGFQNEGVPVANLSIPCRYTHTPIETINIDDLDQLLKTLVVFTSELEEQDVFGKS